jgi:hypothetical protein
MTKSLNDEFMQQVATEQAWKNLSEEFPWTESLLEKYFEKVDWKVISGNRNINWTIPMLQKFAKKIDWKVLSEHIDEDWFTEAHLEIFKDKWDWTEISSSDLLISSSLIDKYIDYVDWAVLIGEGHYYHNEIQNDLFDAIDFYEKYKEHIPMSKIQDSQLWNKIVENRAKQLKSEILS